MEVSVSEICSLGLDRFSTGNGVDVFHDAAVVLYLFLAIHVDRQQILDCLCDLDALLRGVCHKCNVRSCFCQKSKGPLRANSSKNSETQDHLECNLGINVQIAF